MNTQISVIASKLPIAGLVAAGALVLLTATPEADARRPMPPQQPTVSYTCELPVEAAESVRAAYREHYACVDPYTDEWLEAFPREVSQLSELYDAWVAGRSHDLRDRRDAARFVRENPVDFTTRDVRLTPRQVDQLSPSMSGQPPEVAGIFQRFFVDQAEDRMFLTTDEEGLVSIDTSLRYAFGLEGTMGSGGGKDFFIVDGRTALMEEPREDGSARDLVVLDISDRADPQEIHRLPAVLPVIKRPIAIRGAVPDRPPTFDEYRAIRLGRLHVQSCGAPPTVSTHPGQACRPDGSCYRRELHQSPVEDFFCERSAQGDRLVGMPQRRSRMENMAPMPGGHGGPVVGSRGPRPQPAPRPRMQEDTMARSAAPAPARPSAMADAEMEAPRGGSGGAGSLSQMMIKDSTLFVLSAAGNSAHGWLSSFDISNPRRPRVTHMIALDNGPEALQIHDTMLLVAGRDALVTASAARSDGPRLLGERRQVCPVNFDPVVVEGAIAYRTIITTDRRRNCQSRLEVIDLSQPHQPTLRTTENLRRPRGVAVLGDRLFVADEPLGVRVFDLTDPVAPRQLTTWKLEGVKDLVLSEFDLYALTPDQVTTYFVGPLYQSGVDAEEGVNSVYGQTTVVREK